MDPITLLFSLLSFIGGYALCAKEKKFFELQYHKLVAEFEALKKKL